MATTKHRKGLTGSECYELACALGRRHHDHLLHHEQPPTEVRQAMDAERQFVALCLFAGGDRRLSVEQRTLLDGWMENQEQQTKALQAQIAASVAARAAKQVA